MQLPFVPNQNVFCSKQYRPVGVSNYQLSYKTAGYRGRCSVFVCVCVCVCGGGLSWLSALKYRCCLPNIYGIGLRLSLHLYIDVAGELANYLCETQ